MKRHKYLAIRFDIDSITCFERGIPKLKWIGRKYQAPFSFYVNMGKSFNFGVNVRSMLRRHGTLPPAAKLGLLKKLTLKGLFKTVFWNPPLGKTFLEPLEELQKEGHELGLHGGMDHSLWQHGIHDMDYKQIADTFEPAYNEFNKYFGVPKGFASPGFQFNDQVCQILDVFKFQYSTDMSGDMPFPTVSNGRKYGFWQVPVNVIGQAHTPVIEELLAKQKRPDDISKKVIDEIRRHEFALIYGHPYVEGYHINILDSILAALQGEYEITTVNEYLNKWRTINDR